MTNEEIEKALEQTTLGQLAKAGEALRALVAEVALALKARSILEWISGRLARLR